MTLYERYPALSACEASIESALDIVETVYRTGGKLLVCGNGGSAADSDHIVGELMKGFMQQRPICESTRTVIAEDFPDDAAYLCENLQEAIPAISLSSQTAVMTAFANDVAADMAYAQLVNGYGMAGDLLWGLSTSGNSANIVNAAKVAHAKGLNTIAMTGQMPCALDSICDIVIKAPALQTYEVQEYHLPIYHYICAQLETRLFGVQTAAEQV